MTYHLSSRHFQHTATLYLPRFSEVSKSSQQGVVVVVVDEEEVEMAELSLYLTNLNISVGQTMDKEKVLSHFFT